MALEMDFPAWVGSDTKCIYFLPLNRPSPSPDFAQDSFDMLKLEKKIPPNI